MNDSGVKIEVHLIQNFAPSNLNRDDTGQPKSATFGGVRRARVSSQCTKKTVRERWRADGTVPVGQRTKKLQQLIGKKLGEDGDFMEKVPLQDDRRDGIRLFTNAYYAAADKKKPENTSVLVFIGPDEVNVCADAVKDLWDDSEEETNKKGKKTTKAVEGIGSLVVKLRKAEQKKAGKKGVDKPDNADAGEGGEEAGGEEGEDSGAGKAEKKAPKLKADKAIHKAIQKKIEEAKVSADISLFGRMLAEQPGRNTDGACQVAHPISTHKVDMEMDFYTAVDDLNPAEETGTGMMGVVGYNSACYYRYAVVDRDLLARNLAAKTERKDRNWISKLTAEDFQEADEVIKAFLQAMVYAIPTGKQNSFAAQNLPSFGLFVRRQGGLPISLANAFAKPVRFARDDDDLVGRSVEKLTAHWDALKKVYGDQGVKTTACFHLQQDERLNGLKEADMHSVAAAIKSVMQE